MSGIYGIFNKVNKKVYIGQTIDFDKRFREHKNSLDGDYHINHHLQNAWKKYGSNNFEFRIIEECDNLTEREQFWIDYYGGIDSVKTYNNREAGDSGTFSEETRLKISQKNKGHKVSEKTRQKLRDQNLGRHHTEEAKRKIGENHSRHNKGKHLSEETKRKLSESLKGRKISHKGHKMSEETKRKIGEASKLRPRRKWTDEEKQKQSERLKGKPAWNKGKTMSYKGRKLTDEQKCLLSERITKAKGYAVEQYNLNEELITIYKSTMEASRNTNVCNAGISACCRGKQKTAGGYIWKKHIG